MPERPQRSRRSRERSLRSEVAVGVGLVLVVSIVVWVEWPHAKAGLGQVASYDARTCQASLCQYMPKRFRPFSISRQRGQLPGPDPDVSLRVRAQLPPLFLGPSAERLHRNRFPHAALRKVLERSQGRNRKSGGYVSFAAENDDDEVKKSSGQKKMDLIEEMKSVTSDEELYELVDKSFMLIDTHFWLKINSLARDAGNTHEAGRINALAQKVWNRLEELNKEQEDDSSNGLEEYYAVLGSPDEEIEELTAEQVLEKRTKRWINEQLSEMWRNFRTFEKFHVGEWHGNWETYDDLLGGERVTKPSDLVEVISNVEGHTEKSEDGFSVCRHTQTATGESVPYPQELLGKALDFWPNSPKTWLVANIFSTSDRVVDCGADTLAIETAVRCEDLRMRVLTKYHKLNPEGDDSEGMVLASVSIGREKQGEVPSAEESALYTTNSILGADLGRLVNSPASGNITLATRGNLILQAPRIVKPEEEHWVQVSWKTPPSTSLSEELAEVYGEAYSKQAAERGLIVTTKRVFSKLNGAAEYISLKEELPDDWKQEY